LSDGEKRKVAIAAILVNDPETLILDEPAVGLDPLSVSDLVKVIGEIRTSGAKAIAIVSHDMEVFLPILDRMMVLDRGRMAAVGSPAEVCSTLGNDPAMRSLLPPLPVLVADLRKAGYPLDADEFRVSVLAKQIAAAYFQSGGGG
jgi:ABC-type multidrug transport system ATPase subunit